MRLMLVAFVFAALMAGTLFAAITDCADGTKYFKCSTANPGYLCAVGGLQLYTKQCPCTDVAGYIQQGDGDTATCVLAKCSDNTQSGQCSPTKPKYCTLGQLVDNATKCGCPAGKTASASGLLCVYPPCNDNGVSVPDGTCSSKKGKKCVNGVLVDKASECGCATGETRDGETCGVVCTDGTKADLCSPDKPKECVNGYLIDNAVKCGCPSGKMAVGKQCTDSVITAITGADLLSGGSPSGGNNSSTGSSASGSPLSCCCLPAALIGIAGGFVFIRKK